jgi:hypothetical protein
MVFPLHGMHGEFDGEFDEGLRRLIDELWRETICKGLTKLLEEARNG